ncbi:hypothetical protein Ancab_037567 [Ancistrocladus abbreviatus]
MSTERKAEERTKQVEGDVREMVTAITNRLAHLHKTTGGDANEEDEPGVRIITLSGSNVGATMKRSEMDAGEQPQEQDDWGNGTYVNSNFQAVNNSIMMNGSCSSNDPGVHLNISDYVGDHDHEHVHGRMSRGKKIAQDEYYSSSEILSLPS